MCYHNEIGLKIKSKMGVILCSTLNLLEYHHDVTLPPPTTCPHTL